MSGVLGMTGLLLETPLADRQRGYAENIRTSGESLLAILNDILDYSKVETGKLGIESIPFSLKEVIGRVVDIFGTQAADKKIELHTAIDTELPAAILGDPQRLTQVIANIVGNAVKFTAVGEIQIAVKVRRQTVVDVELEISVRDTGIGIADEDLTLLFTAFSQADASITRRFGGTGLGLVISRQLVELMGGTIQAQSTPGKGSVFTVLITFPIAQESGGLDSENQDLRRRPEMSPISGDGFNIHSPRARFTDVQALVAEDHEINREIIVELLRQVGIEADIATNGRDAVEMVRVRDYDVVFMDIQMPEMDGITATREIRNLGREGVDRLPILATTSHALIGDRELSLVAGMSDHLIKPINRKVLVTALRQWLPPDKYAPVAAEEADISTKQLIMLSLPTPALDMKEGLERLGGNWELYLKLLKDFIAHFEETPAHLLQELRADRLDEAVHLVHLIRGVAGNLGGEEMEAAAADLENALNVVEKTGRGIPFALGEPLRVFIDCHGALLTAIGMVLVEQPVVAPAKPEGTSGDAAELRPLLERLKRALASDEPRPCKEILGILLQRRWSENHEIVLTELNRLVHCYRLAEAFTLLDKELNDVIGKSEEMEYE
jgi:CheY-like chemotaxis protein/HPt (histidine-containing phosphotransfer) domain-containing protein